MHTSGCYLAIESSSNSTVPGIVEQVNKRLIKYINELREVEGSEDRAETLFRCVERIFSVTRRFGRGDAVKVTERELQGLRKLH